mmetsp:Transcript_7728/g.30528  ORF Transcript_7728/g.30528 Transcript_7728/m.30528 type:complete len:204 (+) Transcript_7728:708-1319(+)
MADTTSSTAEAAKASEISSNLASHPPTRAARRFETSSVTHRRTPESGSATGPSRDLSRLDSASSRASATSACIRSRPTPARTSLGSVDKTAEAHHSWFTPAFVRGVASRAVANAAATRACCVATSSASGSSSTHAFEVVCGSVPAGCGKTPEGSTANTLAYASAAWTICECAPMATEGATNVSKNLAAVVALYPRVYGGWLLR